MEADLRKIAEGLARLSSRERGLAAFIGLMGAVAALALSWSLVVALVVGQVPRAGTISAGAVALGLGVLSAAVWTGLRWRDARDRLRQARRVEALRPELRGRLVTTAEREGGPIGSESPALLALAARRANDVLEALPADEVYPARPAKWAAGGAAGSLALLALLGALLPVGPMAALAMLKGESPKSEVSEEIALEEDDRKAVVGEIVLRYEYPDYTGLDPLEVPNSNGTAHGPPGTRVTVTARTAEVFQSARLQVGEGEPVAAALENGRDFEAAFTIEEPGAWRVLLSDGASQARSPDYAIEVEEDLPPVVELEVRSERLQVAWNERIPIGWSARDDYGLTRVTVRINGDTEVQLREPLDATASLRGALGRTPEELGLSPGDEAVLEIQAWDNDEISGSKAGRSRRVKVVVMGPRGQARRVFRFRRELRDALVDVLAGFVTDDSPPATQQAPLALWGESVAGRFDPLDELVDEYWDAMSDGSLEGLIMEEVRRLGGGLLRFVQVVADPRSQERVDARDLVTLTEMRGELVEQLETAVLMLDKMVRLQAIGELYAAGEQVTRAAELVEARALADAGGGEVIARLAAIDRVEPRLLGAAEDMAEGPLPAFVQRSVADADLIEERLREVLSGEEPDGEKARLLVRLLADNYRHLLAQLEHMQQEAEEENQEMESRIQELIEKLEKLETSERDLLARTREARETLGGNEAGLVSAWERAEALAVSLAERTERLSGAESNDGFFGSLMESAATQSARLSRAVKARDLDGALLEVRRTQARVEQALRNLEFAQAMGSPAPPDAAEQLAARDEVVQLEQILEGLDDQLNRASPALQAATAQLGAEQTSMVPDTAAAAAEAASLAGELPMGAPGLLESMDGAQREMDRSAGALDRARAVEAEGAERATADHIRQAIEALSQAASALEQMQEAMQQAGAGGEQAGSGNSDDGDRSPPMDVEIPTPEDFRTPEEYRQALLEGMKGDVPPEYRALKRRYYEELVRQ